MADDLIRLSSDVSLSLKELLVTRLLIAGNSGSGKSYTERKLCEQVVRRIPTIIIDREGEYVTMREKYDMVLVGKGGEVDAHVSTAAKVARKIVELKTSAIIDISELSKDERRKYVRLHLESLLSLPSHLWTPILVLIDECHDFAPESGREVECAGAVRDLFSKGRKRGLCGVAATQRLSKIDKDVTSETNNMLLGRFAQDVDLRRVSDLFGFAGKSEWPTLQGLKPGEFFAVGPAFQHHGTKRFKVDKVETTHVRAGQAYNFHPPQPSKRILKFAPELADLKRQVVEEQDELTRLRAENKELRSARSVRPAAKVTNVIDPAPHVLAGRQDAMSFFSPAVATTVEARKLAIDAIRQGVATAEREFTKAIDGLVQAQKAVGRSKVPVAVRASAAPSAPIRPRASAPAPARVIRGGGDSALGHGQLRQLMIAIAQHPEGISRTQLAMYARASITSSHFSNNLSTLRVKGWAEDRDRQFFPTEAGLAALGSYEPLPTGKGLVDYWLGFCGEGAKRRLLQALLDAGRGGISRPDLAVAADMSINSSHFSNLLSELRGAKLMEGSKTLCAGSVLLDALEEG